MPSTPHIPDLLNLARRKNGAIFPALRLKFSRSSPICPITPPHPPLRETGEQETGEQVKGRGIRIVGGNGEFVG